jgi:hypothetical protein
MERIERCQNKYLVILTGTPTVGCDSVCDRTPADDDPASDILCHSPAESVDSARWTVSQQRSVALRHSLSHESRSQNNDIHVTHSIYSSKTEC